MKTKSPWAGIPSTKAARKQAFAGGRDQRLSQSTAGRQRAQQSPVMTFDRDRWGSQSQRMMERVREGITEGSKGGGN